MILQKLKSLIALPAMLLTLASCDQGLNQPNDPGGQGESKVTINTLLRASSAMNYPTSGEDVDLGQLPTPKVGDFLMSLSQAGTQVTQWQYDQQARDLTLSVGKYTLKASYGTEVAADWNTVFYDGSQDFVLSNSEHTADLKMDCALKTAFAFARFDDKFRNVFSDISVRFITEHTREPLVFVDGETRIASFAPADTLFVLVDVKMRLSGKSYTYGIDPLAGLHSAELNVFNFTVNDGQMVLNLTTDNAIRIKTHTATLDPDWLATRGTKMTTSYDEQIPVQNVYKLPYLDPLDIVVGSNIGIHSIDVGFDAQLAQELGVETINLLDMTSAEKEIIDNRVAVELSAAPDGMNYRINLRNCPSTMEVRNSATTEHKLIISATNILGFRCQRELLMEIEVPQFSRFAQDASKIWNRYAYIPQAEVTNVPDADKSRFPIQYWISQDQTTWKPLGVITPSEQGIYVNGLEPSTTYFTRAAIGQVYDMVNIRSFTTQAETQIPNSDFEQYTWAPYGGNNNPFFELYAPQEANPWWATNNAATTYNRGTSYTNYAQSYASVQVVDGNGGKAVQIATVGWGDNAKVEHSKTAIILGKDQYRNTRQEATAGKVFLGSYLYTGDATTPSGNENQGMPFDKKPIAMRFKYKFDNYKSGEWQMQLQILTSSGTPMATASYSSGATQDMMVQMERPIIYQAQYFNESPAQITLCFTPQTTSPDPNADLDVVLGSDKPGGWNAGWPGSPKWKATKDSYFRGNTLTIDDIELIYPQDITDKYTMQ